MFRGMRITAGVSVRAIAARVGIDHSTVSRWERGERDVADATVDRLLQALADLMNEAAA
jgi:transcriptional regulator with XRE-family HTH domain